MRGGGWSNEVDEMQAYLSADIGEGVGSEGKGEDRSDCGAGVEAFPMAR